MKEKSKNILKVLGVGSLAVVGACTFAGCSLNEEDKSILDTIIQVCGKDSRQQIVNRMHNEKAYRETTLGDVIQFKYAMNLSVD